MLAEEIARPRTRDFAEPEPGSTLPDILHPEPLGRIDVEQTKLSIALAFASGDSPGVFSDALNEASVASSTWRPESFAKDLFLADFVSLCFRIKIEGKAYPVTKRHLVALLAHPPKDPKTVMHRRAVLAELIAQPVLKKELERLYALIARFRTLLESTGDAAKWDPNRRHLDLLAVLKEIFDCAAEGFLGSKSGLVRLAEFGRRVHESEPYQSLADLLRYDERLATMSLNIQIGADGRVRGFKVVSVHEDEKNPFVQSPWRRWLAKLELFARGYTLSEREVMSRLVDAVFEGLQDAIVPLVQLFGELEFFLGALGLAEQAKDAGLAMALPSLVSPGEPRTLEGLFNPLLLAHGVKPVPCTIAIDRHAVTTLITGPNSGGKTRLLQSLGLTQLLAQSGLLVPAKSGTIALVPGLVMSLIEEARSDQAEGRLGTELVRIRELFERLPPGAMVILDELCSGTNPSEGEEIFELVVEILGRLEPQAFITTHFLLFAARLEREKAIPDLRFLQVELGPEQRPTYQFVPGVATTSLAGHAAARLGVTRDELLSLVERNKNGA
jgi:DNA mismatch repair protein MutS2